jgi:Ni,Fe-hydrogenase III large subunit
MYLIATNPEGQISRVAVRDPSAINWQVVPHAAADNVLLDFPLINKSFNMSYSGNDI